MLVFSCCQLTSYIGSFHFRNMPRFDTLLLWYTNIWGVNLRGVVNQMLIKQNINDLLLLFCNVSTNCQQNRRTTITCNLWVNATHSHRQQTSSLTNLQSEQMALLNLPKYNLDNFPRCQNEIYLWCDWLVNIKIRKYRRWKSEARTGIIIT